MRFEFAVPHKNNRKECIVMKKKFASGIIVIGLMIALTGCCFSHEWEEATCTNPKTCAMCGEVEGEVLEHEWKEATCSAPKTCSVCGETEGESLEHTLTEANYQQASICSVCGDTVGEPLKAYFEEYELTEYLVEQNKEYDYIGTCAESDSHTTVGKAVFCNYRTYASDGIHPKKEGYEWKSVDVSIEFADENANSYGPNVFAYIDDYYDDVRWCDEDVINYYGVDYTECIYTTDNTLRWSEWENNKTTFYATFSVQVPIGYDGLLITFTNKQIEGGEYIGDLKGTNPLFFRFE